MILSEQARRRDRLILFAGWCALSTTLSADLAWAPFGAHRIARLPAAPEHAPGFTKLSGRDTGVTFRNTLSPQRQMANANLMNGSGLALGDYDGDGLIDIYFCDLSGTNALYKNLGNWHFTNVTEQAGVACPKQTSTGAVFADVNGDGKLDLLVSSMGGPHACFINVGNGRFTNTIASAGFSTRLGGTSMALADIDGNGTLDLYICNYGATSILRSGGALNVTYENGKPVVHGRYAQRVKIIDGTMWELGEPDGLYLNDGHGRFRAVSWTGGAFLKADGTPLKESEIPWDQGLSVMLRDLNGDGAPDIYVCNDAFTPDRFWINDGKGHFREWPHRYWRNTSHFSMGIDVADVDRDGRDDLFVVDMLARDRRYFMTQRGSMPPQPIIPGQIDQQIQLRRNTLLHNRGGMDFEEIAFYSGVAASDWSWSGLFLDVDLDGWEDILVANGFEMNTDDMDTQEKIRSMGQLPLEQSRRAQMLFPRLLAPNAAFRNKRDLTFEECGQKWGFDATDISQGMAFADLDNDGDLDVVVSVFNGEALVYRNDGSAPRLGVRLKGLPPNTEGIGAKITVEGGPVRQTQEMISGGRYCSGDAAMRVFACGSVTNLLQVQVVWRDGRRTTVDKIPANSIIEINEADSQLREPEFTAPGAPLFVDASNRLKHKHAEDNFDDFALQPSLPRKLSQAGPAVVVADVTGDGNEDILVGTGLNGSVDLFRNSGNGQFEKIASPLSKDETGGLLAWKNEKSETELLISIDNYEKQTGVSLAIVTLDKSGSVLTRTNFPGNTASGPLAISEVDGQIYLFQGSRCVPGAYPLPAPCFLYRRENAGWVRDTQNDLSKVGLVNGAMWADLNGDGRPELVLASEWSAIRIFSMSNGHLREATAEWRLDNYPGLWQSVAAADIDGDGRLDLVAGNWGLNNSYVRAPRPEVELYYGAFGQGGRIEMLEAYYDEHLKKVVPWHDRKTFEGFWPWLNERFPTHAQYAEASVTEIFAGRPGALNHLTASTLATCIFLNRGDHFERVELTREAQFAPVFGINVADFDGDGTEDIFLGQNFSAVREFDGPLVAGRGLLLKGTMNQQFIPMRSEQSGIQIFGDQRGSAIGDFDRDGRIDLLVTQNATETKLYQNKTGTPGLRISFRGGAKNPLAAGAQWRIWKADGWGPLHEVQVGAGYWSQDGAVKIAQRPAGSAKLEVRWPGGKPVEYDIPDGALEVGADQNSGVKKVK